MANYAVVPLSGGTVNNVVVGDSLEQVRQVVGDVVEITEETGSAGIGYTWDAERNAFIPPKPYDSWILNEDTYRWEPPVAYPEDGLGYDWNEETLSWETSDS